MQVAFGEYIRKLRTDNNLTLTQLGAKLNIDSGALSKIETGKKQLDEKVLPKLAKVFKLNLDMLKDEFFSEKIAYAICKNKCSENILLLVEEKIKYIRIKNTKQGVLKFTDK
ncbi:helix-turn-helix protein [Chitinophaga niastensis]|uniref:Helix-turn-helix protein n=1 Tax=Chitinophaga niastensis TaxID=536980 RepID=A0A2P8HVR9_CHINA|nr:helix-turn-helix transcriptional regulator [Chitinophaga niastensis]PSL50322.1 helix-turn-helix protein [Chitinophaga niastensis]